MSSRSSRNNRSEVRKFLEDVSVWIDGCWLWIGCFNKHDKGYGTFYHNGRRLLAHRYMWELIHGTAVPPGKVIMHTCDNSGCVNPDHLVLGTQQENIADMIRKDRQRRPIKGFENPNTKVTEELIISARKLKRHGHNADEIAAQLMLGKSTVAHIISCRSRYDNWARKARVAAETAQQQELEPHVE